MECEVIYLDGDDWADEWYGENPRPISWPELQSMKDLAAHYLAHGTKSERKLAHGLGHAVAWISAEAKAIGQRDNDILYPAKDSDVLM